MIIGSGILIGLFIVSSGIDSKKHKQGLTRPSAEQIVAFSESFLKDSANADLGKKLDCSGFTRAVFKNFDLQLGVSAAKQFENCETTDQSDINSGNLVFFNTRGKGISHVGISISSELFIHSPGKNRFVKIDSFSNNYWHKRFIRAGKIKD